MNMDDKYWCEACETKVDAMKGFYTCNDCGVVLHISCLIGDFSYIMPGSFIYVASAAGSYSKYIQQRSLTLTSSNEEVVSNTSICRPRCAACNSRRKLPFVLKVSNDGVVVYICSLECYGHFLE